jgi:hypothetical protein
MTPIDGLLDEIEVNFTLLQTGSPGTRVALHATNLAFGVRFHKLITDPHAQASWSEFCEYCDSLSRTGNQMDEVAAVGCLVFIRHRIAERSFWSPSILAITPGQGTDDDPARSET